MLETPPPWPSRAGEEPVHDGVRGGGRKDLSDTDSRMGIQDAQKDTAPQKTGKTDFGDTFLLIREVLNPLYKPPATGTAPRPAPDYRRGRLSAGGPAGLLLRSRQVRKGGGVSPSSFPSGRCPPRDHARTGLRRAPPATSQKGTPRATLGVRLGAWKSFIPRLWPSEENLFSPGCGK